jgi:hypothetical protein
MTFASGRPCGSRIARRTAVRVVSIVCFVVIAGCSKRSVSPLGTLFPAPVMAVAGATPPSISERSRAKDPLKPPAPSGVKSPRAGREKQGRTAVAVIPGTQGKSGAVSLDLQVPVQSAEGAAETIHLAAAIREALNTFSSWYLLFESPDRMRLGTQRIVRLTTRQNLTDLIREQLQTRGIPPEYIAGILTVVTADLTSPERGTFVIRPEQSDDARSPYERIWRVEALKPGSHNLELKVTLTARLPSRGDVESDPAMFSRPVSVGAGPFYWIVDFVDRNGNAVAGSLAGLLAAGVLWIWWRVRQYTALSHR